MKKINNRRSSERRGHIWTFLKLNWCRCCNCACYYKDIINAIFRPLWSDIFCLSRLIWDKMVILDFRCNLSNYELCRCSTSAPVTPIVSVLFFNKPSDFMCSAVLMSHHSVLHVYSFQATGSVVKDASQKRLHFHYCWFSVIGRVDKVSPCQQHFLLDWAC